MTLHNCLPLSLGHSWHRATPFSQSHNVGSSHWHTANQYTIQPVETSNWWPPLKHILQWPIPVERDRIHTDTHIHKDPWSHKHQIHVSKHHTSVPRLTKWVEININTERVLWSEQIYNVFTQLTIWGSKDHGRHYYCDSECRLNNCESTTLINDKANWLQLLKQEQCKRTCVQARFPIARYSGVWEDQ